MSPSRAQRPKGVEAEQVKADQVDVAKGVEAEQVKADQVDVAEAARLTEAGLALLVDVREDDEWTAGHVPTALHVPLGSLPQTQLPTGRLVLAIFRSGNRSAAAAAVLLTRGVDALNVRGGMRAWQDAGLPVTSDHEPPDAP